MSEMNYVQRLRQLGKDYPVIAILPADEEAYRRGIEQETARAGKVIAEAAETVEKERKELLRHDQRVPTCPGFLHAAFDAYIEYIKRSYLTAAMEGETQVTSPYGNIQVQRVKRFKERHEDVPLDDVRLNVIQSMIDYWRARPNVKGTTRPIAVKTAQEHIKQLRAFFKWLNKNEDFAWRKPLDFDDVVLTVKPNAKEIAAKVTPIKVKTFDLSQLCLLHKYATPFERALLLLGLNCGFGAAEISTLLMNQVRLSEQHPYDEFLGFHSTSNDSFIKRLRIKTSVYGEWLLWPETVAALEWAIRRRHQQLIVTRGPDRGRNISPQADSILLLSEDGTTLVKQTESGNTSSRIANIWNSGLIARVVKDNSEFPTLSFGKLRKTAGDLVRRFADGEVSSIFLCHGTPVQSDSLLDIYSNRPFGKVFDALRNVRKYLEPVFQHATEWPDERKKGGANLTVAEIDAIQRLHKDGVSPAKIADEIGVSVTTVYRRVGRKRRSGRPNS